VLEVGRNLRDLGASVIVISRRPSSRQPRIESIDGLAIHRVYRGIVCPLPRANRSKNPTSGDSQTTLGSLLHRVYLSTVVAVLSGLLAARLIKKHRLDVVIERETSFGAGAIASIITRRPLILEVNGPRFSPISARRASKITAYSMSGIKKEFRDKVRIVNNGVNPEVFRPDSESRASVRKMYQMADSPVVCYVGTFQKWHGLDDLVKASVTILEAFPHAKFLMVGPRYEATKKKAEELGVSSAFIFVGPVPYASVAAYVNAADIMVSPANPSMSEWTRKNGLPVQLKIFEYMACMKPVIVTAEGPMQRVVKDGETGLTIPPGDHEALAEAICKLVRDPRLANKLAWQGYAMVLERFTWSKHAGEIYQTLLSAIKESSLVNGSTQKLNRAN
jgi:glycosyltransferase involved in cell wall biosynthesis